MSRKIFLFLILSITSAYANDWFAEVRGGYFYPQSNVFRKIFRDGGFEGEIEVGTCFCENWITFANAGFFCRDGRSIGLSDKTHVTLFPISVGLKYVILPTYYVQPYVGLGFTYSFIHTHDYSPYADQRITTDNAGFVVKSVFFYDLPCNFFLDVFFDYYYTQVCSQPTPPAQGVNVNIGGFRTGLGLGYEF